MTTPRGASPMPKSQMAGGMFDIARRVPPPTGEYRWIKLWGLPLRVMHWIAALSIVALVVTGLYIGRPYFMSSGEASSHFLMGWFRFVHFTFAALLVMTGLVRVYWLLVGNRFERLPALFPVRPRDWRNLIRMVRFYLLIHPERGPRYLGHNPLQQLSYTLVFLVTTIMVITGFAMYGQSNPGGMIYDATNWVNTLLGGAQITRFIHHVFTWYFVIFVPMHVYLTIRADFWERQGTVSSIFSGGRFVPPNEAFEDDEA